jgi:hypothetical protein
MSPYENDWERDRWYLLAVAIFVAIWIIVFLVLTIQHEDELCLDGAPHPEPRDHCVVIG